MREIEILVKVLESKKSALKKLSRFKKDHVARVVDKYYYHPANKNMMRSKNLGITEYFRIRRKDTKSFITYKKDKFKGKRWLYADEYELEISDPKNMEMILKMLKMKSLVTIDNIRTFYYYKNYEIVLEDVKGLGLFLEIERLNANKERPERIREEIFKLIEDIGMKVSPEMKAGKPELMYNKTHKAPLIDFTI